MREFLQWLAMVCAPAILIIGVLFWPRVKVYLGWDE